MSRIILWICVDKPNPLECYAYFQDWPDDSEYEAKVNAEVERALFAGGVARVIRARRSVYGWKAPDNYG